MRSEEEYKLSVTPLTNEEIQEMLRATLHGHLPQATMSRVFATLAEVPELRARQNLINADYAELELRALAHMKELEIPKEMLEGSGNRAGAEAFAQLYGQLQGHQAAKRLVERGILEPGQKMRQTLNTYVQGAVAAGEMFVITDRDRRLLVALLERAADTASKSDENEFDLIEHANFSMTEVHEFNHELNTQFEKVRSKVYEGTKHNDSELLYNLMCKLERMWKDRFPNG